MRTPKAISLKISKDNSLWLNKVSKQIKMSKEDILEEMVNNRLEELRNSDFTLVRTV